MNLRLLLPVILTAASVAAGAESVLYTNATVHTMGPQGTLENANVLIDDGRIVAVGSDVAGDGAVVIDASGKIITPGYFSAMGQLGTTEVSQVAGTVDYQQAGDTRTASFKIADAYNPRSTLIGVNRVGGVTRAFTAPAPGDSEQGSSVFSGLGAVVQLGDSPAWIVNGSAAMVVNLGENGGHVAGGSRAAAFQTLRLSLDDAIDYRENRDAHDRRQRRQYSMSREDLEALQQVIAGRIPLLATVHRAADIEVFMDIVGKYDLRAIVYGGSEAWMLADRLAAANIAVILNSKANLASSFDALNARLESSALLVAAGVDISFGGDWQSETFAARNIAQSAGNAVANGLAWDAALRAITLAPARMFGLADRVGSIEPGKDADLILWTADPLEVTSNPEAVLIRGEPISMVSRQTLLRDRYLDPDDKTPPAWRR